MAWIFEHIEELLTTLISRIIIDQRKNTDSKIIDIATCQTCKHKSLAVESTIFISHYYQTAKSKTSYESIDGLVERPAHDMPNSDRLGDFHRIVAELMVCV